jgi:hypothetical protein
MVASSFPLESPRGSKKPTGAVIPTTTSSLQAESWVVEGEEMEAGAKAALWGRACYKI